MVFFVAIAIPTTPKASKGYLRNVRCIKGGLLRKGGCLANADIGPKKQHFHWKTVAVLY